MSIFHAPSIITLTVPCSLHTAISNSFVFTCLLLKSLVRYDSDGGVAGGGGGIQRMNSSMNLSMMDYMKRSVDLSVYCLYFVCTHATYYSELFSFHLFSSFFIFLSPLLFSYFSLVESNQEDDGAIFF